MTSRRTPFTYVNLHGQPLGTSGQISKTAKRSADERREQELVDKLAPADLDRVFDALVLAGWRRGKTALTTLLRALDWRREGGGMFGSVEVGAALRRLATKGCVQSVEGEGWSVPGHLAEPRLAQLLAQPQAADWWRAWLWVAAGAVGVPEQVPMYFTPRTHEESVTLLRLVLVSGIDCAAYNTLSRRALERVNLVGVVLEVLAQLQRMQLLERVDVTLRWQLLASLDQYDWLRREPALLRWVEHHIALAPAEGVSGLRLRVAEQRLQRGDDAGVRQALAGDAAALQFLPLMQSVWPAAQGRLAETAAAFPPAWKALTSHLGKRRGFAPQGLLQWYPLALMAQSEVAAWATARKFCVAMSGSRTPSPHDDWGRWAHVLAVRLGDERLEPRTVQPDPAWRHGVPDDLDRAADRVVLAAWIGQTQSVWPSALVQLVSDRLHAAGLHWKADLVLQAAVQLGWPAPQRPSDVPPPWPVTYFGRRQDAWREALSAIAALGDGRNASADRPLVTLHWLLKLDRFGRVQDLQAFEPPASARGKLKQLSLLQLKKRTRLDPRDAAVARCLRQSRYRANDMAFDLVGAAQALVGHPGLALADAPTTPVELAESLPILEVRRERCPATTQTEGSGEHYVFRLHDEIVVDDEPDMSDHAVDYDQREAEIERRNSLRVVCDSPERARLIRITPAQRRVAELVSQRWTVPADAVAELDAALRVLSGHFVLHSDAVAGEAVPSHAQLLAQLQPRADALMLTLVVRPFGDFGPVLAPGHGRARLMTLHRGVSLATERDLDLERNHLAAVLERLPFLGMGVDDAPTDGAWLLDDPEQALAAVHELGRMAGEDEAVRAVEWPKGQPVRVHAPQGKAFATTLASRRAWLELQGELRLDEGRVLSLQQLLALLRDAQGSRYVALGEGQYLRLADQLRQRLAELDALGESAEGGVKLGSTAGAWLADAASELGLKGDAAWRRRATDLERAAALEPAVPAGLQATLRPYQLEGY